MSVLALNPSSNNGILANNADWATVQAASTGSLRGAVNNFIQTSLSGGYNIDRGFMVFDTSSLPDNAVITSVTLEVTGTFKNDSGTDACTYNVFDSTCSDTIVAGDFDLVGTTPYATAIAFASWNGAGTNTWTFNATGIAAINLAGLTKICLREAAFDVANTAPAGVRYVGYSSVSTSPVLTITYTATAEGGVNPNLLLMGVG